MPNFNNIFPDKREEATTSIEQIQTVLLRMLKIVDYICQDNNIDYVTLGGWVLGAYRHQGFIPWDTDGDIGIAPGQYEKLYETWEKIGPKDIFLQSKFKPGTKVRNDPHWPGHLCPRFRDCYSSYYNPHSPSPKMKPTKRRRHCGFQIDIFPLKIRDNTIRGICDKFKLAPDGTDLPYTTSAVKGIKGWGARKIQDPALLYPPDTDLESPRYGKFKTLPFEDMVIPVPYETDKYLYKKYHNPEVLPRHTKYLEEHNPDGFKAARVKIKRTACGTRPPNHPRGLNWDERTS